MTTVRVANIVTPVVVCPGLEVPLLIGADFLRCCVLDFPNRVATIGPCKFPMDLTQETYGGGSQVSAAKSLLPKASSQVIQKVLDEFTTVFSNKEPVKVAQSLPAAEINTTGPPIRQQCYRLPLAKRESVEKCVEEMLEDGVIRPSDSPWASPITLVPKKDGSTRFCVDYRRLNMVTRKDAHPLPHIQDIFDQLKGSTVFSTLDMKSGYWQVPMAESSIPKTAFTCHLGLFEFTRLPFGLTNAPAIFQRSMNKVLSGLIGRCCMVYIDDVVVFSKDLESHAEHLRLVLQRLKNAGLQLKLSKCEFEKPELELLGYVVSGAGIRAQPDKISAIANLAAPTNVKALRSFLGMAGYYRQCVKGFAALSAPLTDLTKAKTPFIWGDEQTAAFEALKHDLVSAPILVHPEPSKPYSLYTDASDGAIGAILVQKDEAGVEQVVSYLSNKLSGPQLRWPTIEKEAFGVVYALKKLHPYLWGSSFEIHTDHKPLKSLFSAEIHNTKLQRWAIQISEYGAPILYHQGKLNVRADMLSRIASVRPAEPVLQLSDPPAAWQADELDPKTLRGAQLLYFPDEILEASQDLDESPYFLKGGLLYSQAEPYKNAGRYPRLVLPQPFRQSVIDRCHKDVAHAALDKTLARVQETYVWPGMRKHIHDYLKRCVHCNTLTPTNPPCLRGEMPIPPRPWHTWGIDIVGRFPRDQRGKEYLLTCVDHLTGWAEAYPIRSKENKHVWEALSHELIPRYGLPTVLVSDNGGEFTATAFEKWLREVGIDHRVTSPYHPQSNGKCERFNGVIQKTLLKLSGGQPRHWTKYLPDALYAYRITKGPAGISPYLGVFGQHPRLPKAPPAPAVPGERLANLLAAVKIFQEYRQNSTEKYLKGQSPRAQALGPGALVSVRALNPRKGTPRWQPGYQIVSSRGPALVVRHLTTGEARRVNQSDVREIPEQLPYDEVDPLPPLPDKPRFLPPPNDVLPILPK